MPTLVQDKISILNLADNTIVIKKATGSNIFITTSDSMIINKSTFIVLLNFLIKSDIISTKVLSGILEEYNTL